MLLVTFLSVKLPPTCKHIFQNKQDQTYSVIVYIAASTLRSPQIIIGNRPHCVLKGRPITLRTCTPFHQPKLALTIGDKDTSHSGSLHIILQLVFKYSLSYRLASLLICHHDTCIRSTVHNI